MVFLSGLISLAPLPAKELDPVRVQLKWLHQFQFAGYYAAVEKGFYREAGLDVTLIEGKLDVDPAHVVLDGGAEFGVGTPEILLLRAEGKPLVVLGVIFQHSPYIFLELEDSGISNVSDLAGKRVMIEPQAAELYAYLAHEKVPIESLTILPHSFTAEDLVAKKVDAMSAYITDEPFALHKAGIEYSAFNPRSSGVDFYGDCFFTTEYQVKEFPDRTRAFYQATLKGWNYALEHPAEIIELILNKYSKRKSREALQFEAASMRDLIHPDIVPIGYMYEGRWKHIMETYEELGMIKEPVPLKRFLYDPNPKPDHTWLFWMGGILLGGAIIVLGVVLPIWRLNRKLSAAKDAAEKANQAKTRFVATVSHELRAPMNGVVGFAGLLSRTPLSEEQRDFVKLIDTSAQSLVALIDDLLDFSKIEAGGIEIEAVDFSLYEMVADVRQFFEPLAATKSLPLRVQIASTVPELMNGDVFRIRQVLLNLLGNALKFTEAGAVSLDVNVESVKSSDGRLPVKFIVRDTGPGMTPEEVSRVFEPFLQADSSIRRRYGGTGLGLTISKRLVEIMGGTLELTSQRSEGTMVRFTLPLSPATGAVPELPPQVALTAAAANPESQRILVAEDDPVSAKLMRSLLGRMGHHATIAETGRQTLAIWQTERPEVVFMDMQLPDLSGVECISQIRRHEAMAETTRVTRIIALTANADEQSREDCLSAGADLFLTKPVSLAAIQNALA
jgi:signal transduction histidine kinase/CheY-like chemotaxis protein